LLLNGRFNNLVYGSYALGAPDDAQRKTMWLGSERCYLVASDFALPRLEKLVDKARLHVGAASGASRSDESAGRTGLTSLLDWLALCPIGAIKARSAAPAAVGHQSDDADQPIEKAVGHGTAHIRPTAVRTPQILVAFFHAVIQYGRPS
jgi:hypothetical protein